MEAKEWFWSCISLLIHVSFLVIVTWLFHKRRVFPFLFIVMWQFHIWNFFLFFCRFVQKVIESCFFQIHFVNFYRSIQMAAIMLQTIPSFYTKLSEKGHFISANTYEKYNVCKDYCNAHHDDKTYFSPACKYHNIVLEDV